MKQLKLNLVPGDGIGIDVVNEGVRVLKTLQQTDGGVQFEFNNLPYSCEYYSKFGKMLPEDGLKILEQCDAIILGAVGFPGVPDSVSAQELLFPIRQEFDQYVNMRPIKLLPGLVSPLKNDKIDFVVIRENSEGEYCKRGRIENDGTPEKTVIQESVFTRKGTERIMRYAMNTPPNTDVQKFLAQRNPTP